MTASEPTSWIKAARSGGEGSCVEMRRRDGGVEVRDSKAGESGPVLRFAPATFSAWLDGARRGEFDHLPG
jgi:hypothetical protein